MRERKAHQGRGGRAPPSRKREEARKVDPSPARLQVQTSTASSWGEAAAVPASLSKPLHTMTPTHATAQSAKHQHVNTRAFGSTVVCFTFLLFP